VSRTARWLTCLIGVLLVGCALAVLGYALAADDGMTDLGWVVVVTFGLMGAFVLRRAANWNKPLCCTRCGAEVSRGIARCPRCGLDVEKSMWAAMGELKLP
jgi:hypothetical protein